MPVATVIRSDWPVSVVTADGITGGARAILTETELVVLTRSGPTVSEWLRVSYDVMVDHGTQLRPDHRRGRGDGHRTRRLAVLVLAALAGGPGGLDVSDPLPLGERYRDEITGYEGIATARVEFLYAPPQVQLTRADKDGSPQSVYFEEPRLTAPGNASPGFAP